MDGQTTNIEIGRPVAPVPDAPSLDSDLQAGGAGVGREVQPVSDTSPLSVPTSAKRTAATPSAGGEFGRPVAPTSEPVFGVGAAPRPTPPASSPQPVPMKAEGPSTLETLARRVLPVLGPLGMTAELAHEQAKQHPERTAKDYAQKPVSETVLGLPQEWSRQGAGPLEAGIEKGVTSFASGLTTPLSLGLMVATSGLGSLARGLGAEALAKIAPELAPSVSKAAGVASKLVNGGFTVQQVAHVSGAVPQFVIAAKNGDIEGAARAATDGLLSGAAAAMSTAHLIGEKGPQRWTQERDAIGRYQNKVEIGNVEARQFERDNAALIKDKPLDMAARLYHEAGGDAATLDRWKAEIQADKNIKPAIREKYTALLEQAKTLPPEVRALSDKLRTDYAADWREAVGAQKVRPALQPVAESRKAGPSEQPRTTAHALHEQSVSREDALSIYRQLGVPKAQAEQEIAQAYAEPGSKQPRPIRPPGAGAVNYAGQHVYEPDSEGDSTVRPTSRYGITKNPAFMKRRTFDTYIDAIKAGFEPKDIGLAAARADYVRRFGEMRGAIEAEESMLRQRADDGRPVAVAPSVIRQFGNKPVLPLREGADLSRLDPTAVIDKNGRQFLDLSDYQKARPPFERFKFVTNDEEGEPVFKKAPLLVHPDFADRINKAFEADSWFRRTPVVSGLLKTSATAKQLLLSLSPFHYVTEINRGLQMGLDPVTAFRPPRLLSERPAVQIGTQYGLTLLGDRAARSQTAEGVAANAEILNRVPGLGPVLAKVQDHLFGDWIPRLKAETWERLVPQLERRHPDWTPEQRYALAAKITNAAYGGLNWRQLGWSMSSVDALRLVALAPDFTGSQLAFAKYGLQPGGSAVWQSFARIALYNFGVAQTLNLLFDGKVHPEHPFSVQSPTDKNKVISVRTMPSDIFHAMTDPREFTYNRLNPLLVRTAVEAVTGRDIRGQKVGTEREVIDLLKNVTPISLQNLVPAFRYPDQTTREGVLKGLGLTVSQDVSPALRLARQLASDRAPSGPVASDEVARHQFKQQLEAALQSGAVKREALSKLVDTGRLTRKEAREISEAAREAAKIPDPLTAQLALKVKHLPMREALQVWDMAANAERRALLPTLREKRIHYRQEAYRDLTARERERDPVFQRTQTEAFK